MVNQYNQTGDYKSDEKMYNVNRPIFAKTVMRRFIDVGLIPNRPARIPRVLRRHKTLLI